MSEMSRQAQATEGEVEPQKKDAVAHTPSVNGDARHLQRDLKENRTRDTYAK
jgi:hypothetical protein